MDAFKIAIKFFAAEDSFAPDQFVPIFHKWIQRRDFPGHMLIDVADYAHVKSGPGTVLIAHEANISMDRAENRLGILYTRKTPIDGSFPERLSAVFNNALEAARRMAAEESLAGKMNFKTEDILVRFNDRLLTPAAENTLSDLKPGIESVAKRLFAQKPFTLESKVSRLELLEVRLKCADAPAIGQMKG